MTRDEILQTLALNYLRPEMAQEFLQKAWQERDALAAEIAAMKSAQANLWKRIKRADIETMPELKEDWRERTAEDEYNRWLRILTAAEHGWLCPKCGAPAHRGEFKKQLDALVEPLYMKVRGSAPSRDPVTPQESEP